VTVDGVWIDDWIYYTHTLKYNWVSPDSLSLTTDNWVLTESLLGTTLLIQLRAQFCDRRNHSTGIPCQHYPGNCQTQLRTQDSWRLKTLRVTLQPTTSRSVHLGFEPVWGSWPNVNYCLTVTVLSISGAPSDERSGLSFVLVTWTASVQYSKFAAGPRHLSIYLSVFITPGERVAQLYPQALGSSGTHYCGPLRGWRLFHWGPRYIAFGRTVEKTLPLALLIV
jgi:hypothetical protein